MSQKSEPTRRRLPQVWRYAMWHTEAGLIVSPFNRELPLDAVPDAHSTLADDLKKPRVLEDDNIYLAFYPRRPVSRGPLFSVLSIPHEELANSINDIGSMASPQYILDPTIRSQWRNLETSLLDVATTLYTAHKYSSEFPLLTYPRWPLDYGYDAAHKSREATLRCAKRSIVAFAMLSAFTSFVLSLWLSEYEDDSLDAAFDYLANHRGMPRVWLQYMKESVVCTFTPGMRPGGYLNPYTTLWGPHLRYFTRACVPFWLLWGRYEELDDNRVKDKQISFYFPPLKYVRMAKTRDLSYRDVIMPSERNQRFTDGSHDTPYLPGSSPPPTSRTTQDYSRGLDNFIVENADAYSDDPNRKYDEPPARGPPIDRVACVETGSGQRAGETWEQFFIRQNEVLRRRIKNEDLQAKQRRLAYQAEAEKGPTKKCTVYLWVQDEVVPSFYRRTRVLKSDARTEWKEQTQYQRFFWSHRNEWDLCPQLPAYPPGMDPPPNDEDEETFVEYMGTSLVSSPSLRRELPQQTHHVGAMMLETVRVITERDQAPEEEGYTYGCWQLFTYLGRRHGFSAQPMKNWNPSLHAEEQVKSPTTVPNAIKNLNYLASRENLTESESTSIVDFHNTAMARVPYTSLPATWDLSPDAAKRIVCDKYRIRLQQVADPKIRDRAVYILRPPQGSRDTSQWFVATYSPTAVLLAYRSPWNTMLEIARGFLQNGIPFHTVIERRKQEIRRGLKPRIHGLGSRPARFTPTREDYEAYKIARTDVLRSMDGRAIRMMGGIVGRLASEIVPDYYVLDGPNLVNELVVGVHGCMEFVDDAVEEERLDIVSGVYHVEGARFREVSAHLSWWPKQHAFQDSGYAANQWLPREEDWYKEHCARLDNGVFQLQNATAWKQNIRTNVKQVRAILGGSERIAADFIANSSRLR